MMVQQVFHSLASYTVARQRKSNAENFNLAGAHANLCLEPVLSLQWLHTVEPDVQLGLNLPWHGYKAVHSSSLI